MTAGTEPQTEGIPELGRRIADDARRLVQAEIGLAKAHAKETVIRFALGAGLIVGALLCALFFVLFLVGTLDEGVHALDSWPLYAAAAGLLVAPIFALIARSVWRGIAWLFWIVALLGALAIGVGLVWFLVAAIIGGNGEEARRGWAITATVFFGLTIICGGAGGLSIVSAAKEAKSSVSEIKEDASWVTRLMKREKSGN